MDSIFKIKDHINALKDRERQFISNMYDIQSYNTGMIIPKTFEHKILKYILGNTESNKYKKEKTLDQIRNQKILKVVNRWTYESALYNYLRAFRPGVNIRDKEKLQDWIKKNIEGSLEDCDFCYPEKYTPEDEFGRIYGKYCITAANLARFDSFHSLLIFKRHNPLEFTEEEFSDYIDTAFRWFSKVSNFSPEYRYHVLMWNCLPRAGASQIHGHMQMLAAKNIYPKMMLILDSAIRYRKEIGYGYFDSLYNIHNMLGLSIKRKDIEILCYITPIKENEVFIIAKNVNDTLKNILYGILRKFIDDLDILNFNLSLYEIPENEFDTSRYIIRIVDRGNILSKTSDFASMELYASSVIAHDPLRLKKLLTNL